MMGLEVVVVLFEFCEFGKDEIYWNWFFVGFVIWKIIGDVEEVVGILLSECDDFDCGVVVFDILVEMGFEVNKVVLKFCEVFRYFDLVLWYYVVIVLGCIGLVVEVVIDDL